MKESERQTTLPSDALGPRGIPNKLYGIPRANHMLPLGKTLKLKVRMNSDEEDSMVSKDLHLMRGYISQVESVLNEMKDWVVKKEKSISSKASLQSRTSMNSKRRSQNGDKYKRSQRAKIFFGYNDKTLDVSTNNPHDLNCCFQHHDLKGLQVETEQSARTGLGVYIKECFMANIKQRMMPQQRRRNAIHRNRSGCQLDKFKGTIPKGFLKDELIEFLTPIKKPDLQKSTIGIGLKIEHDDSLVYTASRRRSSLRFVSTEASEGAINNFD
jgi:hypothetical protein